MKLVVFPGSASPAQPMYYKVYDLLRTRAGAYGYTYVDTSATWPGHSATSDPPAAELTLDAAVSEATRHISAHEDNGEPYDILARSFGSYVSAAALCSMQTRFLRRLILWGPPPYWILWRMFIRDAEETHLIARRKWMAFGPRFFPSVRPLETTLPNVAVPCYCATGTEDIYCRPDYPIYLQSVTGLDRLVVRAPVAGAPHEVYADLGPAIYEPYLDALLSQ